MLDYLLPWHKIIPNCVISQKNFNALLEEKLLKVDDLARNVDRLSLYVDSLKL